MGPRIDYFDPEGLDYVLLPYAAAVLDLVRDLHQLTLGNLLNYDTATNLNCISRRSLINGYVK